MRNLTETTDRLEVVLAAPHTTNAVNCVCNYRNMNGPTGSDFLPGRKRTDTNGTTDVDISGSPATGYQFLIENISIYNADTITHTVTVKFQDASGEAIFGKFQLLTGEALEWNDKDGWIIYTATGVVKSTQNAAGSNTQIQFNNDGVLGASSDFTFNDSTNELGLNGTNTGILIQNVTNEPSAPASGKLKVYAKAVSGRSMLKQIGPAGVDTPLQNAIFQNNIVTWTPAAAAGVYMGTNGSNLGTPAIALPTTTNLATMMRRSTFPSVVTTANQQVGIRTEAMFFRGNAANLGGFFFVCRFMFATWTAGNRLFVGFTSGSTSVVTVQPSTLTNMLGFGIDAGDTAITFMHNDGAGTCTKDPISGQPSLATNQGYIAYIFCAPNDSTVYYRLDDVNLQTTIIDTSTNTDLPVNTANLTAQCIMGNAANVVAGNATIGVNSMYIETDI